MSNSKNDAIPSFMHKKTENREGKISNKSHHANTFYTIIKLFCVFCKKRKKNDHVSSECKKLTNYKKNIMLKREDRCYKYFHIFYLSSQYRIKLRACEKCSIKQNKLFCFNKPLKPNISENQTIFPNFYCNLKNTKHVVLLQTCCVTAQPNWKS